MTDAINNLPHILEEHRKWRMGEGGACAYLADANLACAYLACAYLAGANLAGAYLTDANLARANLADADLASWHIIDGGQRRDGYRFVGWVKDGALMIRAGCRDMRAAEYRNHNAKRGDGQMRDETAAILDHIERVARVRGLVTEAVL